MRALLLVMVVATGCGDDSVDRPNNPSVDAPDEVDAPLDAPPLSLDCASYCTAILDACGGALAQYESMADCLGMCEHLPVGALGQTVGNTLGCRVYHTEFARQDPDTHCEHAGPGGGTICGASSCEGFCSVAPIICPTQWQANTCATRCGMLTSTPPYSINSTGDTLECRLYHLTAATTDAATHCPHTDRMNSATCQ
jgi:hypothetical protein